MHALALIGQGHLTLPSVIVPCFKLIGPGLFCILSGQSLANAGTVFLQYIKRLVWALAFAV